MSLRGRLTSLASRAKEGIAGTLGKAGSFASRTAAAVNRMGLQGQDTAKQVGQGIQNVAKTVGSTAENLAKASPLGQVILPQGNGNSESPIEARASAAQSLLRKRQAGAGQISYTTNQLT